MADIKPTSFRVAEEDIEKFKDFMEKQGIKTQADGFKSIMQTVELAQAKGQIKDRAKEVELFQDTINRLMGYYLNSLETNQHSEERIRDALSKELNTKDHTISNLQDQLNQLKEDNKTLKDSFKNLESSNKDLLQQVQELNNSIVEKQKFLEIANRNNINLQDQLAEYRQYKEQYNNLEKTYKAQIDKLKQQLQQLQEEIKEKDKAINDLTNSNIKMKDKIVTSDYVEELHKGINEGLKLEIAELKANTDLLEQKHKEELKEIKAEYKEQLEQSRKDIAERCKVTYAIRVLDKEKEIHELNKKIEQLEAKVNKRMLTN